jgi:hypothetical protein
MTNKTPEQLAEEWIENREILVELPYSQRTVKAALIEELNAIKVREVVDE